MKSWLIFYNLASAAGWAYVFVVAVQCLVAGMPAAAAWEAFGPALTLVQSTMAFEILHALLGMVPSPVFVTAMQVSCWPPQCPRFQRLFQRRAHLE